jgi:hypothetical protein
VSDSGEDLPALPLPDPPGDESSWSASAEDSPWGSEEPDLRSTGRSRMPDASEWVGIAVVVIVVLLAMWGLFWVLGEILF